MSVTSGYPAALSGWHLKKTPGRLLDGGCPCAWVLHQSYGPWEKLNPSYKAVSCAPMKTPTNKPSLLISLSPLMHFLGTTCPTPISVEHADIRVKNYSVNSRERYVCNSGFKRKAGTSTLTECVINKNTNTAHWTTPNLKCISKYQSPHCSPASRQG